MKSFRLGCLGFWVLIALALGFPVAALEFSLSDGSAITGEIESDVTIEAAFGTIVVDGSTITAMAVGDPATIRLQDGSLITGRLPEQTLAVRWTYGVAELALSAIVSVGDREFADPAQPPVVEDEEDLPVPRTVYITGGSFLMGADDGAPDERPARTVRVDGFRMTPYEITNAQYVEAANWAIGSGEVRLETTSLRDRDGNELLDLDDEDSRIRVRSGRLAVEGDEADYPVVEVTWFGGVAMANWLSLRRGLVPAYLVDGRSVTWSIDAGGYRLPTEAEWEYAARGGQAAVDTVFAGSDTADEVAWHEGNSGGSAHPVGTKQENEIGLYDMSGNVWEWVWDLYDSSYYSVAPSGNPTGPDTGSTRVLRGGSWYDSERAARVSYRYADGPSDSYHDFGFRLVLPAGR